MSPTIFVDLPAVTASSYPLWIDSGLLDNSAVWMPKNTGIVVVITDHCVKKIYASSFVKALNQSGYKTLLLSFPAGEKSKNNRTKARLEAKMLEHRCGRDSLIIALGGGVVGDLAGFVAATYMRGIPYIQIPTTLLAMLDSSVGGKTAIDTPYGKNLIGAFWQPKAVVSDIACLKTLPKEHIISGLMEALKMFLTSDKESLTFLQQNIESILNDDESVLANIVYRAVSIKADVVKNDEKECHQRVILNFGHTIGHALEHISHYQLLHGYAVAYGVLVEAKIAELMGYLNPLHYQVIKTILNRLDIRSDFLKTFDVKEIIKATQLDKKARAGIVNYVLLKDLGQVYVSENRYAHAVSDEWVSKAFYEVVG